MVQRPLDFVKFVFKYWSLGLKSMVTYWWWWNSRIIGRSNWVNIENKVHNISLTHHHWIWNLTIGFKECNERSIPVIYGHNQVVEFRERRGQSLVKVGQTRSNIKNGPKTTKLCEIHIRIVINGIEKCGDIMVLVKFENNWMVKLKEHCHKGTQHVHHMPSLDLKYNHCILRV